MNLWKNLSRAAGSMKSSRGSYDEIMEEGEIEEAGTNEEGNEETYLVVTAADESERSSSRNIVDESCASYHLEKDDACKTSIQSLLASCDTHPAFLCLLLSSSGRDGTYFSCNLRF